uniref:Uncharacterized protein n=1 Tax=Arundo donax TaxID=35708 RepID=A0A0A8ZMT6_ARUDO
MHFTYHYNAWRQYLSQFSNQK